MHPWHASAPSGWCVGHTHMHPRMHACLFTPEGLNLNSMLSEGHEDHILLFSHSRESWLRSLGSVQTLHLLAQREGECSGFRCWAMSIWCLPPLP